MKTELDVKKGILEIKLTKKEHKKICETIVDMKKPCIQIKFYEESK